MLEAAAVTRGPRQATAANYSPPSPRLLWPATSARWRRTPAPHLFRGRRGRAGGLAGGRVPQPDRAVAVGAGQQLAVRAERHPGYAVAGVGPEGRADALAGRGVPQPHGAV